MNQFSFLFSPIAKALGTTLLYSLWQAFIVFCCLRIILKFIRHSPARFGYNISCLSSIGIAAWFVITFIRQISLRQSEIVFGNMVGQDALSQIVSSNYTAHVSGNFSLSFFDNYLPWLTAIYLSGMLWFAFRLMLGYFQTIRLRTDGLTEMDSAFMDHLWSLAEKMNIKKPVYAYISKYVLSPVMIGFFRPMILLPIAAINNLSPQQLEAILLHELAHIRRNDYLLNLLQSVIDILLFFNPFAYWISKNIRNEREKCCDEMALQSSDPYQYARALLTLEESGQNNYRLVMGTNNKPSQLLHRIKNIMEMKNNYIKLRQKIIALAIVLIATISIAWLTPRENKTSKKIDDAPVLKKDPTQKIQTLPALLKQINYYKANKDTSIPQMIPPAPPLPPAPPIVAVPPEVPAPPPASPVAPIPPKAPAAPIPPVPPLPPAESVGTMTDSFPSMKKYFDGPEWKKQMEVINKSTMQMTKYFQSDAWKNQQKTMQHSTAAMNKYFKSPEWKHQLELIHKNTKSINDYINSPEWKKYLGDIQKSGEQMNKYFNSDEWKKQQKEIQKNAEKMSQYFKGDEWKKQQEKISHSMDSLKFNLNTDALKKQNAGLQEAMAQTKKYFESDAWKKQ
ncbi:MAG: M56 family metallopeptidase [Ginsengibacter sp.]